MGELGQHMLDGSREPDAESVAQWLGAASYRRWMRLLEFIEDNYPGAFSPEWLFYGKKYGWALRFKKSKSFCTLIPAQGRFMVQIVFGREEREKAEAILPELSPGVRNAYVQARTYHDGKWLALAVENKGILDAIKKLLAIKRRPKRM